MNYLNRLTARLGENSPGERPTKPTQPGSVGSVGEPAGDVQVLPPTVVLGLHRLATSPPPHRVADPTLWRKIVDDALRLKNEGWATVALALGWSPLDLWGHSLDRDGLAVWLHGRPIVLIDDRHAIAIDGPERRAQFTRDRAGMTGARLLWEI